jgi:RND family efflux transporter MFP subunit
LQPHNSKSTDGNGEPTTLVSNHSAFAPTGSEYDRPRQTQSPPPPRTGLKLIIFGVLLGVALAIGFLIVHRRRADTAASLSAQTVSQSGEAPTVDVVTVNYAPSSQAVGYPGETRGWYESTIYARVNGYVGKWLVDIGDRVHTGQVLATIETPDLDAQLQAAQHQLAVSQSQVEVVKANAEFAKTTYERWRNSPKGVVSEQEREEKKAEYSSSVAQQKSAEAKVSADQADVDRIDAIEGYKQVTAPYDGVITSRHIDIGDLVTEGSTASTSSLYTVAQITEIRVFVDIPQRAAAGMDVGVLAVATADEFPGREFKGKIARTSNAIDPATRTLHVEVDVENPDLALMPGMYVLVNFDLAHKGLLRVPASALIFKSGGPQVAVVGDDGKVSFSDVRIAIDNGDFVEIGSGISVNQKVALNLSNQIAEGDKVTANDVDPTGNAGQTTDSVPKSEDSPQKNDPRAVTANVAIPAQ